MERSVVLNSSPKKNGGSPTHMPKSQSMATMKNPLPQQFVTPEQLKVESMKGYLPKRYNINDRLQKIEFNQHQILNELEHQVDELDVKYQHVESDQVVQKKQKDFVQIQPADTRIQKPHDFKTKPLRRHENDFLMYKEIFVQPKQEILDNLKEKEKDFEDLFHTGTQRQYDKILHIYDEEKEKTKKIPKFDENQDMEKVDFKYNTLLNSSLKDDIQLKSGTMIKPQTVERQLEKQIQDNVALLEQTLHMDTNAPQTNFFDQQIQIQPPDLPNATIASPLSPGNGYAPSVPLTHNFRDNKTNIKDLLIRAKAGMQAGDIQKEAHLSFYLGMVYESNKNYTEAIKFYKKFFTCARMIEDKIGLALAANRIAVNYFNSGNYEKAIEYHKQNTQLSDLENTFAGFYNIGIAYRKAQCYEDSIANFKKALDWARQRDEIESECLAYGQLGVTYNECKMYDDSFDNFQNCHELSLKLQNTKLQLDCLLSITKITSLKTVNNSDGAIKLLKDAVDCAKQLRDNKTAALCLCNLGVLEGGKHFDNYTREIMSSQPQTNLY